MKMTNREYDILKYFAQIFLPALATLIGTIGISIGYSEIAGILVTIITAFATFLGSLLGITSLEYNHNKNILKGDTDGKLYKHQPNERR